MNNCGLERKALVVGQFLVDCSQPLAEYYLPRIHVKSRREQYGYEAANAIRSELFPLIILPGRVALGRDLSSTTDFPELEDAWNAGLNQEENYFSVALQLVKYARTDGNQNKKSLIIFADTFNDEEDMLIPRIRERAINAGADAYFNMVENNQAMSIIPFISQSLGWK
jgi:hypothetical protein